MTRAAVLLPVFSKEVRALLPIWGAAAAALAAAFVSRANFVQGVGLMAYVGGCMAIGAHSIGHEYTCRTLPMLLSQPADRRRLYLLKFVVLAAMLLALAALAWIVLGATVFRADSRQVVRTAVTLPVLGGLFLAPLLTMICRSSLGGTMLTGTLSGFAWLTTIAIAWFGFGIDAATAERTILGGWTLAMIAAAPLVGLLGWRRFTALEAVDVASPALRLPRWLARADGSRNGRPLRALAAKELHLQQLTFVLVALYLVAWVAMMLARRYIPSAATLPLEAVMLLYCVGLAIAIGALASAEERQHGTLQWQLVQPAPAWQQWMVKVGVTFALALLFGVGLPLVVLTLTPGEGAGMRVSGDLIVLVVLLTASSVHVSSLSTSGVQAMAWSVPVGIAVAVFIQTVWRGLQWVALTIGGPALANTFTGTILPPGFNPEDVITLGGRTLAVLLVPLLLWLGFLNHTSSERTVRRVLQQVSAIALLTVAGVVLVGGVLALREFGSR